MKNSCIVLGDKHQNILESLRGLLETLFKSVVMVADNPSFLQAMDQIKPSFAIVDLSVLGYSEINTACELNKRFPNVKIIVLCGYEEPDIIDDIMSAGASAVVLKQNSGAELFDAIESIEKGQIYISPAIENKRNSQEENE